MGNSFIKIRSSFILLIAGLAALFISCSQNTPELTTTDYSVIFDYENDETPPEARLSVFASSASDVRRYEKIRIKSLDTGLYWEADNIACLESESIQWAGCSNLRAPENEQFPTGRYEITYINADEKECSVKLEIKYDAGLYEVLLSGLADYMKEKRGIEKIAIFDKEHIMIYFGDRTENFKTTRDIWNYYRQAYTYQVIWYSYGGRVICIEPEKAVTPESSPETEAESTAENEIF